MYSCRLEDLCLVDEEVSFEVAVLIFEGFASEYFSVEYGAYACQDSERGVGVLCFWANSGLVSSSGILRESFKGVSPFLELKRDGTNGKMAFLSDSSTSFERSVIICPKEGNPGPVTCSTFTFSGVSINGFCWTSDAEG